MQAGNVYRIRTNSANQFTGALNQNAAAPATLDMFEGTPSTFSGDKMGIGAGKHMRSRLREIRIVSVQNLAWEVWLFGTPAMGTAVIGDEKMLGQWAFGAASGLQATGDTFFYYYIGNLDLAYEDLLTTGKLYTRLINRSVTAKIAGAGGLVEVEFALELLQGR